MVENIVGEKMNLPKIIDSTELMARSEIQWESIIKKKRKIKKKNKTNSTTVIVQAMENCRAVTEQNRTRRW